MKTSKITPEEKFTANVRIFVIDYLCDVLPWAQFDSKLLKYLIFYCPRVQWIALREHHAPLRPLFQGLNTIDINKIDM